MTDQQLRSPATGVLDPVALQKLHELDPDGRNSVVQRVLTAFELSLVRMCTVLQTQAQADAADSGVIGGIAHTLKSSVCQRGCTGSGADLCGS